MEYRGYTGTVEYSEEDNILFGKVLGIRALISYEGESISQLKEDFHSGVDDYLALCQEKLLKPEKPYKGSFNVRIPPEIHRRAAMKAAEEGMSLNSFISAVLENAV